MRRPRQCLITITLGVITTVLIAWAFAACRTVPMYAGTRGATLPRPRAGVFLHWNRAWAVNAIWGPGFDDFWWMDLNADQPDVDAQSLVAEQIARHAAYRDDAWFDHVSIANDLPLWGTFRRPAPPPDGFIIGSDTAFGWPLPCMWYQVIGKLNGTSTIGEQLLGGIFLRGRLDSRGRDFHALPLRPIWTPLLINIAIYSVAWWLLLFGTLHLRRLVRQHRGACPACGYNLQGKLARGCSECGWNRATAKS